MKAVCISCFNYYENRIKYIEKFLGDKGYEVIYITSDFDHVGKVTRTAETNENKIYLKTLPYYKNLSLCRLFSHYLFSINAVKEIKRHKPDLVYVIIPPNSLMKHLARYKTRYDVKLICDIFDLWPETFPAAKVKKLLALPFKIWGNLRDNFIHNADLIITECELFQTKLKQKLPNINAVTLHLTKEENGLADPTINSPNGESINICYLGSINNIIDIQLIRKLLYAINKIKPVTLYIIGDGERREELIGSIQSCNIDVNFLGRVFDEPKKKAVFDKCSFGLNIMKDTVCVGLTMKSIDYFQAGLPLLNNIKADTAKIVELYDIGFNVTDSNIEEVAEKVANINLEDLLAKKEKTREVFDNMFSLKAFNEKLESAFKRL